MADAVELGVSVASGVGEGAGVDVAVGVGVNVDVGEGVMVGVSVDVATGRNPGGAPPVDISETSGAADTPRAINATKAGTRAVIATKPAMFREGDEVGGTGEEYSNDVRVSRVAWRLAVVALFTTIGVTVLAVTAIVARPDVRHTEPLWTDDFDGTHGDWQIDRREGVVAVGVFQLHPSQLDSPALAIHTLPAEDFVAEVRARVGRGSTDNGYGIVVGSRSNLAAFLISGDGYFSVIRMEGDHWIAVQSWRQWPHVQRGDASNTLRVECHMEVCVFYVNDELTTRVAVAAPKDVIGLAAWRYTEETLAVEFDYLKVWEW